MLSLAGFFTRKVNLFVIPLIYSFSCFGQVDEEIIKVLQKKDFSALIKLANKYSGSRNAMNIDKGNIRELTNGFIEATFILTKRYPVNKIVYNECRSKIRLFAKNNTIIYYFFEQKHLQRDSMNSSVVIDTTYQYSNDKDMDAMKRSFRDSFLAEIDEKDLFIDTIYYGQNCGHYPKGDRPFAGKLIDKWVNAVDTTSLTNWLQSANVEKQVYAVEGFYRLLFKGVKIGENVKWMIANVRRKKGTINSCGPCDARQSDIAGVIEWMVDGLKKQQVSANTSFK